MLKKLIVIMAILALVTGVAFGQASLGGQLMIGTNLLQGDNGKKANGDPNDVTMGGIGFHEAKMFATFGSGKGGGKLVLVTSEPKGSAYKHKIGGSIDGIDNYIQTWGFLYWRPIQQFRMQVGVNADGDYGVAKISSWGFLSEAKNSVAAFSDYGDYDGWEDPTWPLYVWQASARPGNAFYNGTGDPSVSFQVFPVHGLTFTFVLPIGGGEELLVQNQLADFHFNVKYDIEGIGLASLAFVGGKGLEKDASKSASAGDLYASFYLSALESIGAELGLTFNLPYEDAAGMKSGGYMGIGAGFSFDNGGPFTIKLRANATLGGNEITKIAGKMQSIERTTLLYANILPCYKINSSLHLFLNAAIGVESGWATYTGARTGWFINPYIWLNAAEGLSFYSGLQFYQNGKKAGKFDASEDSPFRWRIPFGFNFYF